MGLDILSLICNIIVLLVVPWAAWVSRAIVQIQTKLDMASLLREIENEGAGKRDKELSDKITALEDTQKKHGEELAVLLKSDLGGR